jgi:hypothetical protein
MRREVEKMELVAVKRNERRSGLRVRCLGLEGRRKGWCDDG